MFGTSGVRGVVGSEITPELGLRIGSAVASDADTLTVGRDPRLTGEALVNAVVSGAIAVGADVERLGVAPTPTVARYADDTALVVTASHNPPEYNGFKPWNSDGTPFDEDQRNAVEERVRTDVDAKTDEPAGFGDEFDVDDALERHAESVLDSVSCASVKVVVDAGCGAASWITPHVLRRMGCDVVTLNCHYDGRFPARPPEPTDGNLGDLKNAVVASDADLGVAHDGDGDRTAVVDSDGEYVEPDRLLALLARFESADEVVAPINTSMVVDEVADVTRTKVGDVYVAQELEQGGDFGGEPSNSWIFPDETYCPDGVLAAAKVCEMAYETGLDASGLPSYEVRRESFETRDKHGVMRRVEERVEREHGDYTDVDGVRVETGEGWFLIRASGTEPLVRVTAEARSSDGVDEVFEEAKRILKGAIE